MGTNKLGDHYHIAMHARIQGGGGRGSGPPPPENRKNKRFSSNTGADPLKNHKTTKSAFNVKYSSARQRFAGVSMMAPLISSSTIKLRYQS